MTRASAFSGARIWYFERSATTSRLTRMSKRPIVMCTLGTRGDVLPLLAIAAALVNRGHPVTFLANENWRELVSAYEIDFLAIAPEDPPQNSRDNFAFYKSNVVSSFRASFSLVSQLGARDKDLIVVYKLGMLGAQCAAEKLGLSNVKIALQPSAIRSAERPAWPLTKLAEGRFGRLARRSIIPLFYRLAEFTSRYRRITNDFRVSLGLMPNAIGQVNKPEDLLVLMCPEWFALPQSDWPTHCYCAGFPFLDRPDPDKFLDGFIASRGSPIVFTPGTGISNAQPFLRLAREVCRQLRLPGVFLSRHADPTQGDGVINRHHCDLGTLLPKARLLVHHGGIGTTAQALRAGIPQIVLPNGFDQPDNAMRIASLRLGAAVLAETPSLSDVVSLVRRVLTDESVKSRVAIAARDISGHDAAANVAVLVGQLPTRQREVNAESAM